MHKEQHRRFPGVGTYVIFSKNKFLASKATGSKQNPTAFDLEYSHGTGAIESTGHALTKSLILTTTSPHKPRIIVL